MDTNTINALRKTPQYNILGRTERVADSKDELYLIDDVLPKQYTQMDHVSRNAMDRGYRYWWQDGWWGDQWYTPQCVAYAWTHWLEDGPITQPDRTPNRVAVHGQGEAIVNPQSLYDECQLVDYWPGTDYDGTSVRAGAKVLQREGLIESYHWAWDIDTLVNAVLTKGPVVVGTDWTDSMMVPDDRGRIHVDYNGGVYGHAYVINGISLQLNVARIKNSWGRKTWGNNGNALINLSDLQALIKNQGEICLAVEKATA